MGVESWIHARRYERKAYHESCASVNLEQGDANQQSDDIRQWKLGYLQQFLFISRPIII